MRIRVSSDIASVVGALIWIVLLYLEVLVEHYWLGLIVFVVAYALTCWALIAQLRDGIRFGNFAKAVCIVPAALFAFAFFGNLLDALPLSLFPNDYPQWAKFLPSLIASAALAIVLMVPAWILFERWSWLVPILTLILWILTNSESLRFDANRSIADQIVLFEQASLVLIVSITLVTLGPKIRRVFGGASLQGAGN